MPGGSQITEGENDSSTRPPPPCIYMGGNINWNTVVMAFLLVKVSCLLALKIFVDVEVES